MFKNIISFYLSWPHPLFPARASHSNRHFLSLPDLVGRVDKQIPERIHPAGRPTDFQLRDPVVRSQAEMQPGIRGGEIGAAADSPASQLAAAGCDRDHCADAVAV